MKAEYVLRDVGYVAVEGVFIQFGGSGKYAKWLASKFGKHTTYTEPFAGAVSVLLAKPKSKVEVVSDVEKDVVDALRFVKNMSSSDLKALEKKDWTCSKRLYNKLVKSNPTSAVDKFHKLTMLRRMKFSGYGSYRHSSEGQKYGVVKRLPKMHERMKNVRVLRQDWKATLSQYDSKGTLSFLDPPYDVEWQGGVWEPGKGKRKQATVSAEAVATACSKLKGEFVIVYTDSSKLRKLFSKVGRVFTRTLSETSSPKAGSVKRSKRLFCVSKGALK